jgi:RNA polymerase sigma-70 factor, ECF subfamily
MNSPTTTLDWQVERFRHRLHLLALRLELPPSCRARFDTSDVVHEAMLRAHANREAFQGTSEGEFVNWLKKILCTTFTDMVRHVLAECRSPDRELHLQQALDSSRALEQCLPTDSTPLSKLIHEEQFAQAVEAINHLPPEQREVFLLRHLDHLPVRAIAERVGRPSKTIANQIHRARKALAHFFAEPS